MRSVCGCLTCFFSPCEVKMQLAYYLSQGQPLMWNCRVFVLHVHLHRTCSWYCPHTHQHTHTCASSCRSAALIDRLRMPVSKCTLPVLRLSLVHIISFVRVPALIDRPLPASTLGGAHTCPRASHCGATDSINLKCKSSQPLRRQRKSQSGVPAARGRLGDRDKGSNIVMSVCRA